VQAPRPASPTTSAVGGNPGALAACLLYVLCVVYGSLFPFTGWTTEDVRPFAFLWASLPRRLPTADVITNVLAYMPLGLLAFRSFDRRKSVWSALVAATTCGAVLSLLVEVAQQYLPGRVASTSDLVANTLGASIGGALATVLRADHVAGASLLQWRRRWFTEGRGIDLGIAAIGLWALSQLTPLVPSLDIGNLRQGVAPLWQTWQHPGNFNFAQCSVYMLGIAGLALLVQVIGRPGKPIVQLFFGFVAAVLALKVPVISRQLSAEALVGAAAAAVLALPLRGLAPRWAAAIGALLVLGAFTVDELRASTGTTYHAFSWVPFRAQMENTLIGIASILDTLWPSATLASLALVATSKRHHALVAVVGAIGLAAVAFGLEWQQQYRPGRVGDVTTVVLMTATWLLFWRLAGSEAADSVPDRLAAESLWQPPRSARVPALVGVLALASVAVVVGVVLGQRTEETRVDQSKLPQLPAPEQLPPARLPAFKFAHPRLPAPNAADLAQLAFENPGYLREVRKRANGGKGDFHAVALQEFVEPGSVDLDLLYRRLMELKFTWRGHEQVLPLALAYDWLYDRFSSSQLAALRGKLVEGCNYQITLIRKDRLSPYNVYLYNSPFQALMACSLALFGDDPRGEPVMRFTYDYWKNRVLPAWRQIMGRNGGWHEGGEYVGIGIGQTIHRVPAMWRSATGEDLFATEPGLRGFLDFLVYRTRPDGTHFRWGDGSFFDRIVPDLLPLALEYRHAAAYGLRPPGKGGAVPTGWPWGQFTDPALHDPEAVQRLPLTKYFDGIGMIVARSDWSPDATYVTFKAGDNYWSHVHLDQGAFTIYKGGELAIDSGLYGPAYGSDHHLNYTYQAIAHNTVTVTDPADTVPAPGKDKPRPIANDGGQRRVGSGWGVEAAPLDRDEWETKRDIYHTGTMERVFAQDGLTVAVADVTPAYTNSLSGKGTFSHRTRRVERFWRTFAYDGVDDVIVVFDQVIATRGSFRKRWLLHSIGEPRTSPTGFEVSIARQNRPGRAGGHLRGVVLLPRDASINAVGGPGLEFLVDDRNYDESGKLSEIVSKLGANQSEPGAWRIEVSPPRDAREDQFLVVMLPSLAGSKSPHQVRRLEAGSRVGCEIVGPNRTTRWWFTPDRNGVEIEVLEGGRARSHDATGQAAPAPAPPGWLDRLRESLGLGP
jgi:VanZ family protein